jgi:multiple sugar transport system ATP-binding protein
VMGIRPHSVKLGTGLLEAQVVSNQWLGDQSHIALSVAGKLLVAVSHSPIAARPGEKLPYSISASNLHVFDADSGIALSHGPEAA